MKPIRDPKQVEHYGKLLCEMMLTEKGRETEFNAGWVRSHGWKVVPVESGWRLPVEYIPRLISLLKSAGYTHCIAVFNQPGYIQDLPVLTRIQPPDDMTTCYFVEITEADFQDFNREFGPFRSVLTTEDGFWALSTHEWYTLVAGNPAAVEAILDEPIEKAEQEFLEYAAVLAGGQSPDESILQVAKHYAAL